MTDFSEKVCGLNPTYTRLDCLETTIITGNEDEDGPTGDDGEETFPPDGGTTPPHPPPDPEPPVSTAAFATSKAAISGEIATNSVEVTPVPGDNLAQEDLDTTITSGGINAVDIAAENLWILSWNGWELIHFDISTPAAIVKSYTYDVTQDADMGGPGPPLTGGSRAMFYSEKTDRIYLGITHGTGVPNPNSFLVYDVSGDKTDDPTILMTHPDIGTGFAWGFEVSDDESVIYVMTEVDPGSGKRFMLTSLAVDIDAGTFTILDQIAPFGTTVPAQAFGYLRKASDDDLFVWCVDNNIGNKLTWVDTSDPSNMSVLDTYEWVNANEKVQGITLNTDNTRLYAKLATNSAGTLASFDIFDTSVFGVITKVSSNNLAGTVTGFAASQPLIHYVAIDGIVDYLILVHDTAVWTYSVVGDVVSLIDTDGVAANDSTGMSAPQGPNTFRYSTGSVERPPVSANIATVTSRKNGNGVAMLVGLDDLSDPTLDAIIRKSALDQVHGPSMTYIYTSGHLCLLGKNTGTLMIYELGASFSLVATLQDDAFKNCQGLQNSPDEETIWTVDASGDIIEIDVTDPTAPTITSSTPSGPDYFTQVGNPELTGRTRDHLIMENFGFSLVDMNTGLRTGSYLPVELYGVRVIVMDATYAYIWNDQDGGGLAIVDHTAAEFTLKGYLDLGGFAVASDMILLGTHIYITHAESPVLTIIDVSDVSNPVQVATTFDLLGNSNAIAANGANEVVIFGGGGRGGTFTLKRIDVTTPASPVEVATLSTSRALSGGAVANGKAVGFDMNGFVAVSYSLTDPILEKDTVALGRSVGSAQAYGWSDGGKDYVTALLSHTDIYDDEIVVIDVSTITAIDIEGRVDVAGMDQWGFDPATQKGVAVGGLKSTLVRTVDLSTPATPSLGASLALAADLDWKLSSNQSAHSAQVLGNVGLLGFPQSLNSGGIIKLDTTTIASVSVDDRVGDNFIASRSPGTVTHLHPIRTTNNGVGVTSSPEYRIYALTMGGTNPRAGDYTAIIYSPATVSKPESLGPNSSALSDDGTVLFVGHKQASEPDIAWRVTAYDVSDLTAVVEIGAIRVSRPIRSIDVLGQTQNIIIVHGGMMDIPRLTVYDFTDPANPTLTGSLELGDEPFVAFDVQAY